MNDIHAIIAAAKRVQRQQPFDGQDAAMWVALGDARIAMAEALVKIADMPFADYMSGINVHDYWIDECSLRVRIARDCLDKIVKEANRD